jgi:O-antigen/teichoic acid export membrane protein
MSASTQGDRRRIILASMANMAIRIGSVGLLLILNILLARALGPYGFGLLSYTLAWIQICSLVMQFGLPASLTRSLALARHENKLGDARSSLSSGLTFMMLLGAVVLMTGFCWWLLVGPPRGGVEVMVPALILVLVLSFSPVLAGALRGMGQVVLSQIPDQIIRPGLYCLSLTLWILTSKILKVEDAIWLQIATVTISVVAGSVLLLRALPKAEPNPSMRLQPFVQARASMPFLFLSLLQGLSLHSTILLLGHMVSAADLANFRVAIQISDALNMLLLSISIVIGPRIVTLHAKEDWCGLQRLMVQAHRSGTLILLIPVLILAIWSEPILRLIFGEAYLASHEPLRILLVGRLLYGLVGFSGLALSMIGRAGAATWISLVGLLLPLALMVFLVPISGLNGAAWAVVIGALSVNVIGLVLIYRVSQRNMSAFGFLPPKNFSQSEK